MEFPLLTYQMTENTIDDLIPVFQFAIQTDCALKVHVLGKVS